MSKYEWERATLTLPTAAVAPLKEKLRIYVNTLHDEVRVEAIRLHKVIATRSPAKYKKALRNITTNAYVAAESTRHGWRTQAAEVPVFRTVAFSVLESMLRDAELRTAKGQTGVGVNQPTLADVSRHAPKATNKTTTFVVHTARGGDEATITFEGRTLTWDVAENNRAVEEAHEAPLAKVLFAALDRINWTRSTGGSGVGNDEYNRDSDYSGGGSNYTTFRYGPLGKPVHSVFH